MLSSCRMVRLSTTHAAWGAEARVPAPWDSHRHRVTPGARRIPMRIYYLYRNKIILLRRHTKGLGRLVAMGGHLLFGIPKAYLDAVRHHGGLQGVEWGIIGRAFWDGLRGDTSWRMF